MSQESPLPKSEKDLTREALSARIKPLLGEYEYSFAADDDGESYAEKLKAEVAESGGKVMLLMHPFNEEYTSTPRKISSDAEIQNQRDAVTKKCNELIDALVATSDRLPLIILEDREHLDACVEHCLSRGISIPRDIYMVPTLTNMGLPFIRPNEEGLKKGQVDPLVVEKYQTSLQSNVIETDDPAFSPTLKEATRLYESRAFTYLTFILERVGAKDICIGGKYFDVDKNDNNEFIPASCLGVAYDMLDFACKIVFKDMKVELSDISIPVTKDLLPRFKLSADGVDQE